MTNYRRLALAWLPAITYMVLIWALSSFSTLPSIEQVPFQDKGAHFLEYAVLGLLYSYALSRHFSSWTGRKVFIVTCLLASAWGMFDEIHQAFVPGRASTWSDVCADALGATLAAGLYQLISAIASRRLNQRV